MPSTSKLAPELYKSINKTVPKVGNQAGQTMGSRMAAAAGRALKAGAVVGVAAAGAAIGAALVGGFRSAIDQQKIQATVGGLYQDGDKAFRTLEQIKKLSKTSPIDYSAYGKAAQSLAYAGVEGGDAVKILDQVGWAIVGAGGGATELDRAMNGLLKGVNNGGVVMNDTLAMISESGYPIIDALSTKFGTTGDVIKKMAADGEISIDDVLDVMKNGTGELATSQAKAGKDVAKTFGESFKIAKDNIQVAIGETLLPLLEKLAPMMEPISDAIVKGIEKLPAILSTVVGLFKEWWPILATVVGGIAAYSLTLKAIAIGQAIWNGLLVAQKFATAGAAVQMRILNAAMKANPIGLIITAVTLLVAGFILMYKKVGWFRDGVNAAWAAIKVAVAAVGNWFRDVLWPIMQAVWNGIVAGAKWLWNIIKIAWNGIMLAVQAVANWFTATLVPLIQAAVTRLVVGFQVFQMKVRYYWSLFKQILSAVWQWVKTYVFAPIKKFVTVTIPNAFKFFVGLIRVYINTWKLVLSTAWKFVKVYVFNPIKRFVMVTIPNAFKAFVGYIKSSMNGWKRILKFAWDFVRLKVFLPIRKFVTQTIPQAFTLFKNLVKSRMEAWRSIISSVWNWVKKHAFNPIAKFVKETIPNAFKRGVDLVGEFWNKLKKTASKPVKFVVDTVYNKGLVKMWNPIADFIGKKNWKLGKVDVSKFATGGRVSGPGTSTSDSIPARLSNNEHVLTAKDVKNLGGHSNVYALRRAAASGWTPGLATGGTLSDAARWLQKKGARITEFGAWGQRVGGHSKNSLHYSGRAFDANYGPGGQNATEQNFFDRILPKMRELFPKLGYIWRAPGHYNHLHVDTSGGGKVGSGGSGGGGGWIPGLDTLVDWVKSKVDKIGGEGRMPDAMRSGAKKLIDGVADKARSVYDVVGDAVENVKGGIVKGVAYAKGQTWAAMRGLSAANRKRMNWIVSKESGWDPKAKNPRSTASGLPQFINSTARAYLGGAPASKFGVFDQLDGMRKYVHSSKFDRYGGGWKGAYNYWQKHNYYARGTLSAARGWATVGENGPELIKLRGGEQIKSNRSSRKFIESSDNTRKFADNVSVYAQDPDEAIRKLRQEEKRRELLSVI